MIYVAEMPDGTVYVGVIVGLGQHLPLLVMSDLDCAEEVGKVIINFVAERRAVKVQEDNTMFESISRFLKGETCNGN